MGKKTKIILDCDPGHDDAIAILMALKCENVELLGITTVCGNSVLENTTANALRILDFVGYNHIPVAKGCRQPIRRKLVLGTADGPSGLDGSKYLSSSNKSCEPLHAVDFIAKCLNKSDEKITLIPTGPLTNIALFLLKYPELKNKIEEIVLMGGVFYKPNEYYTPTEFNIYCDPEAADIVINSGIKTTMIGLDVTMKVLVEKEQYKEFRKIDSSVGKLVVDWLMFYEKLHRGTMDVGGALHDPLAFAYVIDKSLVKTKEVFLEIEKNGSIMFGATIADFWGLKKEKPNVNIAVEVDSNKFFNMLYDLLKKY